MNYDVIIIGGGLGGLTAGAKLSREGKKVLLIEQHDRPGGYATNFKRGDFSLEVGLHVMYGPAPTDITSKIFKDLEVFEHVEFLKVPEFYRFVNGRYDVTIPHNAEVAMERLLALFPEEAAGIAAYFDQILKPKKRVADSGQPDISLGDFLDSIINSNDLKLILLGNLGYFHNDPYSISLMYYSISQGKFYSGGASFIKGGSQQLSNHLMNYIRSHGSEVLLNHRVVSIQTDGARVTGVRYKKSHGADENHTEAFADEIVANAALPAIAGLLSPELGVEVERIVAEQSRGVSLFTLYLGFNKPVKEQAYSWYSTFVFDPTVSKPSDILQNNQSDFATRSFTFVDYSQVDSGLAPAGKSVGAICCFDDLSDWEGLDKESYRRKKEQVAQILIGRLEQLIPGIRDTIAYYEVGTPATLQRYTLNPGGAVYGFAQTPNRKPLDMSKLPSNLYVASAWGRIGGGFSGAIYEGYLCAMGMMRKR